MNITDIDRFREFAVDFLAGELSAEESEFFLRLAENNETFKHEFRLMKQSWELVGRTGVVRTPPMSPKLKSAVFGSGYEGELEDSELDMVSGGIKTDPEYDDSEF